MKYSAGSNGPCLGEPFDFLFIYFLYFFSMYSWFSCLSPWKLNLFWAQLFSLFFKKISTKSPLFEAVSSFKHLLWEKIKVTKHLDSTHCNCKSSAFKSHDFLKQARKHINSVHLSLTSFFFCCNFITFLCVFLKRKSLFCFLLPQNTLRHAFRS